MATAKKTVTKTAAPASVTRAKAQAKGAEKTGEARRGALLYRPGEDLQQDVILPAQEYALILIKKGKAGHAGWKAPSSSPNGWPARWLTFQAQGTEEAGGGELVQVRDYLSANPEYFVRTVGAMAQAAGYTGDVGFKDGFAPEDPSDPDMDFFYDSVDALLDWMIAEQVVVMARVEPNTFDGQTSNRVKKYLRSEGEPETGTDTEDEPEEPTEETPEELETIAVGDCEVGSDYVIDENGTVKTFTGTAKGYGFFKLNAADKKETAQKIAVGESVGIIPAEEPTEETPESSDEQEPEPTEPEEEETPEEPAPAPVRRLAPKPGSPTPGPKVQQGPVTRKPGAPKK